MNKKIIGILICTLLIANVSAVLGTPEEKVNTIETPEGNVAGTYDNLVTNPSFEEAFGDEPLGWRPTLGNTHWVDSIAHTGKKSVGVSGASSRYTNYGWVTNYFIPVDFTQNIYNISAWAKCVGTYPENQFPMISITCYDGNKKFVESGRTYKIPANSEWTPRYSYATETGQLAEQIKYILIEVGQIYWSNTGKPDSSVDIYIDDVFFAVEENNPPETPIITGPSEGNITESYNFNITVSDPDAFYLSTYVDWGDGTNSSMLVYCSPNTPKTFTTNHTWTKKGDYTIKVKVTDEIGAESDWATLTVTMPCSYDKQIPQFLQMLFERFPNAFPLLRQLMGY
jgi:hypothetical protein